MFNQKQTITMKTKILALVLGALITIPCVLRAEEVEILLTEVVGMSVLPGNGPLDDSNQYPGEPPRPTSFRATINGNSLTVLKQEAAIPSAQAIVVNYGASTHLPIYLIRNTIDSIYERIDR